MGSNALWTTDDLEDIITRAFIGMYDTKFKKIRNRHGITTPKPADVKFVKQMGCYFPPNDRVMTIYQDFELDGLPNVATYTQYTDFSSKDHDPNIDIRDYITFYCARRIPRLPGGMKPVGYKAFYELITWFPQTIGPAYIDKAYFSLDNSGDAHYARAKDMTYQGEEYEFKYGVALLATLQFYADRKYLWNVQALEGSNKGTFGVYPEQVQSLFYARDVPLTETGRKRPILHWVESHHRRLKSGIEIDIDKHMRGVTEFTMLNTKFKITNPQKIKS